MKRTLSKRILFFLAVLGVCGIAAAQQPAPGQRQNTFAGSRILDSGHIGPVTSLAWDAGTGYLFSAGQDGTLRIWQTSPFRLIRKFQVADLPIRKIDLCPKTRDIAIVQSDGMTGHSMKVLNWETGREKFSVPLPEVPLALKFSPQGSFVCVSETSWKSLSFYDAATGRPLSFLQEGFGIVSFLMLSESENTLVSYTPSSGNFIYWDLKQNTQKQLVRSTPELKNLALYNQRYVLATLGQDFVLVDMVSGALAAAAREPGLSRIIVGPDGSPATFSRSGGLVLQNWNLTLPSGGSPGRLVKAEGRAFPLPPETADAVFTRDAGYFALADGSIGLMSAGAGQIERLGRNRIVPLTDILVKEGILYALTEEKLYTFTSHLFGGQRAAPADRPGPAFFAERDVQNNPLGAPAGIIESGTGDIFFWDKSETSNGIIARVDIPAARILSRYTAFSLPLSSVKESEGYLFILEKNGSLKKIETASMTLTYDYPARNIQTIAPVDRQIFWAGKNRAGEFDSPLMVINTETGETVPVETPASLRLVYHITYDETQERVYYIGLSETPGGKTETQIFSADPRRPESSFAFGTLGSADTDAVIHIDSENSSVVYTTLGSGGIQKWADSRWTNFEPNNALAVFLRDYGGLLFGINSDGSVSAWEKQSGKLAGTLFILTDGNWTVFSPGGGVITSDETDSF
jgi:WD40 repeat protein